MEGVTEPCFRDLVIARNAAHELGGAFTEFARVVDRPLPKRVILEHLGPERHATPVGLQIMGAHQDAVAETARRAAEVGVPIVDLNFGCPSKGALRGCAGSALLDDPPKVEGLVRAVVDAVPGVPVSAKIRAGGEDDRRLEDLARAAEAGGASLLTVHCRTRAEGYSDSADWERLRRAVRSVAIPVCGNGGVETHADLERLRSETGCRFAMVGRAALGDPWIFSGRAVSVPQAATFLVDYADALTARSGFERRGAVARLKQLLRCWRAGGLVPDEARNDWLRCPDDGLILARLRELATGCGERAAV
jgi:tRNA-dihydrouridine synthase C